MEAAGWDGRRKEADTFLVASEPCQEAQQVQDPSTPLHSPNPGPTSPHRGATHQEQHQDLPSTLIFLTLPHSSPQRGWAAPAFSLQLQISPQDPGRSEAARVVVEVTHLLCQLTQVTEWKATSGTLLLSPKVTRLTLAIPSS